MEGCSSRSGDSIGSADYKCDCGLAPVVRTSFTYQNMGMRFRCCLKKKGQCQYFHFLPGEERIEGRARKLMLILKDKESRNVKEKDKFQKENGELKLEKEKIIEENKYLMEENAKLLQENDELKKQSGLMDRKIKHLEKKVKKVEMRSSRAIMISQVVCFVFFFILIVVIVGFSMVRSIRY